VEKTRLYEKRRKKRGQKTLVKSTPAVNFINVLFAALALEYPQRAKKADNLSVFLLFRDLCTKKLLEER